MRTIHRHMRKGSLGRVQILSTIRIWESDLDEWAVANGTETSAHPT